MGADIYRRRLRTLAAALLLLALAAKSNAATGQQSLLSSPSLRDDRGASNAVSLVSYDCPNCPCPYYSNGSAGEESSTSPSYQGAGAQGVGAPGTGGTDDSFAALGSGSWNINDAPGGYIDNAILATWIRVRYDAAFNGQRPDRAEFLYARYGGPGPFPPNSQVRTPTSVDYQLLSTYWEILLFPRLSAFVELSAMKNFITYPGIDPAGGFPDVVTSNSGLADTVAGVKYLLYQDEDRYLTFQFKTYLPTGNAQLGLGNSHVSLEPGLLYLKRLSDRSYFQGELRYWIPVNGTDFAGDILRYGGGFGYDLYQGYAVGSPLNPYISNGGLRVTSVAELVGWSILGGRYTPGNQDYFAPTSESAAGNTIVNMKLGLRATLNSRSLYVGWGHALTGAPFYEDLFRLEYRRMF